MLWCFHKKLHIWHFWKDILGFFQVSKFFIQGNGILLLLFLFACFFPRSQNTETAFMSDLSKYFILHNRRLWHLPGLLQWFPGCSACSQLMGGARVWTGQTLKAVREVLGRADPWTMMSVACVDAKNWLCIPDENFQWDLTIHFHFNLYVCWDLLVRSAE